MGSRAIDQRTGRINGPLVLTVYYANRQEQPAYTIVAAPALRIPPAATTWINGIEFRTPKSHGPMIVTWAADK